MINGKSRMCFERKGIGIERKNIDTVAVIFDKTADGDTMVVGSGGGGGGGESQGVKRVRGFIGNGIVIGSEVRFLGRILHFF